MPLTRMEHYLVLTDDIHATRDFYRDILGMDEGFRPPMEFPGYWLYLDATPCIHIADRVAYQKHGDATGLSVSSRASGTGPLDHVAFNATDHDAMVALLEAQGIRHGRNAVPTVGLQQIFLHDPNGVKIELNYMRPKT